MFKEQFKIYSNPVRQDGTRTKQFMCGYCGSFAEYLLALKVPQRGWSVIICKGCLQQGINKIDKSYLGGEK
jgi:hypothetical protein